MSLLHFSRWKTFSILATVIIGLLLALPNAFTETQRDNFIKNIPESMPFGGVIASLADNSVNLGLDLQGGAHMLLEVDSDSVLTNERRNQKDSMKAVLRKEGILTTGVTDKGDDLVAEIRDEKDVAAALRILKGLEENIGNQLAGGKTVEVTSIGNKQIQLSITDDNIQAIKDRTIAQSIEVLRRRIDPQGTTEMTLAKEGSDRILLQVPGAKNIDDIKKRINESANLSFHLVDDASNNPRTVELARDRGILPAGTMLRPYPEFQSELIIIERSRITGECLTSAKEGLHPENRNPIMNFTFNNRCANLFSKMTAENIGKRFAVLLNDVIITAPNIRGAIPGGKGFIEGGFASVGEARELALLINAGALPAKLNIVEERSVGAELGADAIRAGKIASIIGLVGVALFMWISYGLRFGTIANLALSTNIVLIAAALSFLGSTLTLPGIAGIILTIGMAVDANVLIFERIREEAHNGRPPVNAIETGYRRSFAPILDANITTLIAAITLYFVGSGPVRGFAVTLAIGIVMSVFTAVIFARLITATWLRGTRPKTLPI